MKSTLQHPSSVAQLALSAPVACSVEHCMQHFAAFGILSNFNFDLGLALVIMCVSQRHLKVHSPLCFGGYSCRKA
jgi:hypothetical protein